MGMEDKIFQVVVPHRKKWWRATKDGKRKITERKIFSPVTVMVEMIVTDESPCMYVPQYSRRNRFCRAAGVKPIPLERDTKSTSILRNMGVARRPSPNSQWENRVQVVSGPFRDFTGGLLWEF